MKKTKRYQVGGSTEEDLKKEGLDESRNERVSLLERFRMGNIDNPNSEAYKRFGAGRGAAKRASVQTPGSDTGMGVPGFGAPVIPTQAPTEIDRTPRGVPGFGMDMLPKTDSAPSSAPSKMPVGLRSAVTPQGEGGKPVAVKTEKTVVKTPRKSITKTAKVKTGSGASGFGMDEKSFESRRKTPTTSELKSVAKTRAGTSAKSDNLGTLAGVLGAAAVGGGALSQMRKKLMRPDVGGSAERSRAASAGKNPRIMGIDLSQEDDMMRFADEGNPNYKKGGKTKSKPVKKYADGGMVGKASKRADGIAKRGKTKGRIC